MANLEEPQLQLLEFTSALTVFNKHFSIKEDILVDSLELKLVDEFSLTRLRIPCRGINCKHYACFEYSTYVQHNNNVRKRTKKKKQKYSGPTCPLCNQKMSPADIRCDELVLRLLGATGNLKSITVTPEGFWKASDGNSNQRPDHVEMRSFVDRISENETEHIIDLVDSDDDDNTSPEDVTSIQQTVKNSKPGGCQGEYSSLKSLPPVPLPSEVKASKCPMTVARPASTKTAMEKISIEQYLTRLKNTLETQSHDVSQYTSGNSLRESESVKPKPNGNQGLMEPIQSNRFITDINTRRRVVREIVFILKEMEVTPPLNETIPRLARALEYRLFTDALNETEYKNMYTLKSRVRKDMLKIRANSARETANATQVQTKISVNSDRPWQQEDNTQRVNLLSKPNEQPKNVPNSGRSNTPGSGKAKNDFVNDHQLKQAKCTPKDGYVTSSVDRILSTDVHQNQTTDKYMGKFKLSNKTNIANMDSSSDNPHTTITNYVKGRGKSATLRREDRSRPQSSNLGFPNKPNILRKTVLDESHGSGRHAHGDTNLEKTQEHKQKNMPEYKGDEVRSSNPPSPSVKATVSTSDVHQNQTECRGETNRSRNTKLNTTIDKKKRARSAMQSRSGNAMNDNGTVNKCKKSQKRSNAHRKSHVNKHQHTNQCYHHRRPETTQPKYPLEKQVRFRGIYPPPPLPPPMPPIPPPPGHENYRYTSPSFGMQYGEGCSYPREPVHQYPQLRSDAKQFQWGERRNWLHSGRDHHGQRSTRYTPKRCERRHSKRRGKEPHLKRKSKPGDEFQGSNSHSEPSRDHDKRRSYHDFRTKTRPETRRDYAYPRYASDYR